MKNRKMVWLALGALALSAPAFAGEDCKDDSRYPEISQAELEKAVLEEKLVENKKMVVVDVNSESSFKEASIPGSFRFGDHKKSFKKMLGSDPNVLVVAYCGGPSCTAWKQAAIEACKAGFKNVKHFKGGIKAWKEAHPAAPAKS